MIPARFSRTKKQLTMKNLMNRILDAGILLTLLGALTQTASARSNVHAPDATSTSVLLGVACFGLAAVRRFKK